MAGVLPAWPVEFEADPAAAIIAASEKGDGPFIFRLYELTDPATFRQ